MSPKYLPSRIFSEKPAKYQLSAAMQRLYDYWPAADDRENEFFTNFKYSRLTGIGKEPAVSRRDPSKVIKVDGTYYVYYTRRQTESNPVGLATPNESYSVPTYDWDLADIAYATSTDGFTWTERGVAVGPSSQGEYGDRSLSTPDILVWKGKYYLYYQTFSGPFTRDKGDYCDVSMAWAASPDGPWHKTDHPVVNLGASGEWDDGAIHDPYPLVFDGRIWLYYKGEPIQRSVEGYIVRAQGVAIADDPAGPFVKPEINPVLNSGHETFLFPYRDGIAAVLTFDGLEKNTVQFAPDGLNFTIKSHINMPPTAAGAFSPDAFTDSRDASGVSWGLSHIAVNSEVPDEFGYYNAAYSFLVRFDCDLKRGEPNPYFRGATEQAGRFDEAAHFQPKQTLDEAEKARILERE